MNYWFDGGIWSGISVTNDPAGMDYWFDGAIYVDEFPTAGTPPVGTFYQPIVMWFM